MGEMALTLVIPALALAALGWSVPRMLFHVFPEGVRPLMLLALCSAMLMMCLGIGFFMVLYMAGGIPLRVIFEDGVMAGLAEMARLAGISALLWGPILVLSVAGLPKRWVREVW